MTNRVGLNIEGAICLVSHYNLLRKFKRLLHNSEKNTNEFTQNAVIVSHNFENKMFLDIYYKVKNIHN